METLAKEKNVTVLGKQNEKSKNGELSTHRAHRRQAKYRSKRTSIAEKVQRKDLVESHDLPRHERIRQIVEKEERK